MRSGSHKPTCQSTKDLRSDAVDRKREKTSKSKWAPKWTESAGAPRARHDSSGTVHPMGQPRSAKSAKSDRRHAAKDHYKKHAMKKQHSLGEDRADRLPNVHDESSTPGNSNSEASNSPPPEETDNILYSYDAPTGPSGGDQVFGMAVTKAVEKFEDHQTTALVHDQYEVVDEHSDIEAEDSHADEEDGFELI